jgi:Tir chaperone protein (CesT) family
MRFNLSATLPQVQDLMQSLGPASPWIESLIQESNETWTLQVSGGLYITVTFSDEPPRILLSALLGQPEEADQHAVYMTMLCVNLLYAEDHALRVALSGPSGELMLISDAVLTDWSVASLQNYLSHFYQRTSRLMEEIHAMTEIESAPKTREINFLMA